MFFDNKTNLDALPPPTQHRKQDTSAVDAFTAGFGNSYGMFEENHIVREGRKPIKEFVEKHRPTSQFDVPASKEGDTIVDALVSDDEDDLYQQLDELRQSGIEIPKEFDFKDATEARASAFSKAGEDHKRRADLLAGASGVAGAAAFVGGVAGSFDDFENIITLPAGAATRAGYAVTALVEGAVNSGIEVAGFDNRQRFLEKIGVQDDGTRLDAAVDGFLFGAVGGVAFKGVGDVGRLALNKLRGEKGVANALIESGDPIGATIGEGSKAEIEAREAIQADTPDARADFEAKVQEAHKSSSTGIVKVFENREVAPVEIAPTIERATTDIEKLVEDGLLPPNFKEEFLDAVESEKNDRAKFAEEHAEFVAALNAPPVDEGFDNFRATFENDEDFISEIKAARSQVSQNAKLQKTPALDILRKEGVKVGSPLAQELNNLGITPTTHVGLFRRASGRTAADNIGKNDHDIFRDLVTGADNLEAGGQYVPEDVFLDAISSELSGNPLRSSDDEILEANAENGIEVIDDILEGLNLPRGASIKEVRAELKKREGQKASPREEPDVVEDDGTARFDDGTKNTPIRTKDEVPEERLPKTQGENEVLIDDPTGSNDVVELTGNEKTIGDLIETIRGPKNDQFTNALLDRLEVAIGDNVSLKLAENSNDLSDLRDASFTHFLDTDTGELVIPSPEFQKTRENSVLRQGANRKNLTKEVLLHELVHAASSIQLRKNEGKNKFNEEMQELRYSILNNPPSEELLEKFPDLNRIKRYANGNVQEVLAHGLTNHSYREYLKSIKTGTGTLWSKLAELVKDILGIKGDNALSDLISIFDRNADINSPKARPIDEARPEVEARPEAEARNVVEDDTFDRFDDLDEFDGINELYFPVEDGTGTRKVSIDDVRKELEDGEALSDFLGACKI